MERHRPPAAPAHLARRLWLQQRGPDDPLRRRDGPCAFWRAIDDRYQEQRTQLHVGQPPGTRPSLPATDRCAGAALCAARRSGELSRAGGDAATRPRLGHGSPHRRDRRRRRLRSGGLHQRPVGTSQPDHDPAPTAGLGSRLPGDIHGDHGAESWRLPGQHRRQPVANQPDCRQRRLRRIGLRNGISLGHPRRCRPQQHHPARNDRLCVKRLRDRVPDLGSAASGPRQARQREAHRHDRESLQPGLHRWRPHHG